MLDYIALYLLALVGIISVGTKLVEVIVGLVVALAVSIRSGGRIPFLEHLEQGYNNLKRDKEVMDKFCAFFMHNKNKIIGDLNDSNESYLKSSLTKLIDDVYDSCLTYKIDSNLLLFKENCILSIQNITNTVS